MCSFYVQLQRDRPNTIIFFVKVITALLQQYGKHNVYASSLYFERTYPLREIYDVWFGDSLMDFPYPYILIIRNFSF